MTIKQTLALIGASLVALFAFLFNRRGEKIQELEATVATKAAEATVAKETAEAARTQEFYDKAKEGYDALKHRHSALLDKLGVTPDKPNP